MIGDGGSGTPENGHSPGRNMSVFGFPSFASQDAARRSGRAGRSAGGAHGFLILSGRIGSRVSG